MASTKTCAIASDCLPSVLLITHAASLAAPPQVLSVTAKCRDNERRIFDNVHMAIDLTLTNNSGAPIGVPLEFLQQVGPCCVLIDNETQEELPPCAWGIDQEARVSFPIGNQWPERMVD